MSPELHGQVQRLFDAARQLPPERRRSFLEGQTGATPQVLAEVHRLLAANDQAQSFLQTSPDPARHIGRYIIDRELGRGGMGIVYQATDPAINRKVALKLIRTGHSLLEDENFNRDSLLREARAAGPLRHPGIVTIYDVGEAEGVPFVAMELVEGPSLYALLSSGGRLDRSRVLDILRQVAAALDYAHSHGIIHRDIKPANILLEGGAIAKITDFGIAKIVSAQASTLTGMQIGTAYYMSPEQIQTQPLDGRSDQFALAAMAFELLTDTLPFTGDTATSISFKIVHEPRPSAHAANPDLPVAADPVLARGLGKLPAERFPSCSEFVAALEASFRAPLPVEPPTRRSGPAAPLPIRPAGRSKLPTVLAGLLALVLLAALVFRLRPGGQAVPVPAPPAVANRPAPQTPAPSLVVRRFYADPSLVPAGASSTLKWETTGASEVEIDHQVGKVAANGSYVVTPSATTVYRLTAKGPGGSVSLRASVGVAAPPKTPEPAATAPAPKTEPAAPPPIPSVTPRDQADRLYNDGLADLRAGRIAMAAPRFRQAADLGDNRAMNELANLYRNGEGVPHDPAEALKWFSKAAEAGNAASMVFLGAMYAAGDGVLKKPAEALRWFRQAADAGNLVAMDAIGQMYWTGNGVPKDEKQAVDWFQKAAAKGNPSALYDLGLAYETGRGIRQDANVARNLFRQAAAGGDSRAKARLKP